MLVNLHIFVSCKAPDPGRRHIPFRSQVLDMKKGGTQFQMS